MSMALSARCAASYERSSWRAMLQCSSGSSPAGISW
jgi:hypothetical protein